MISSEVQRTLVKSPPELWTELSDPESLARHLGELGDIRIIRVEPENLVEWEAEGTTGTVEIKASGWGTRVTLTVARELPADAGAPEEAPATDATATGALAEPLPDPAAQDAGGEHAPEAAAEDAERAPEARTQDATAPSPQGAAGVDLPREPEPADELHAEERSEALPEPASTRERTPAPATEAARRAAGWPSAAGAAAPAIESDLRAAEALDGPPSEPDGIEAWAQQSAAEDELSTSEERPAVREADLAPPPRRGLLARLFGRRRRPDRTAPAQETSGPLAAAAADDAEPAEGEELDTAPELADEALVDIAPGELDDDEREEEATEDVEGEPALDAIGEPASAERPQEREAGESEAGEPAAAHDLVEDDVEEPHEPEPVTADGSSEPEPPAAEEERAPTPGVHELAAELRAAEEVAAERVEAVLTAVLDRLGAAHHRPFSRP